MSGVEILPSLFRDNSAVDEAMLLRLREDMASVKEMHHNSTITPWDSGALSSLNAQCLAVALTFWSCVMIYAMSDSVSNAFCKPYRGLGIKDQRRWNIGVVRAVFGIILPYFAFAALGSDELRTDKVFEFTPTSVMVMCVTVGFFVFENANIYFMYHKHRIVEPPLIAHHLLGLVTYMAFWFSHHYHFFAVHCLMEEASAPFTTLGWMLTKCGRGTSRLWLVNQVALLTVWVVLRIAWDGFMWYHIGATVLDGGHMFAGSALPLSLCLIGASVLAVYLNPFWFRMKYRQATRMLDLLNAEQRRAAAAKLE